MTLVHARPPAATDEFVLRLLGRISRQPSSPGVTTPLAPYDLRPIAQLRHSSAEDVAAAVHSARAAQRAWAPRPFRERAEVVLRFHDLMLARQEEGLDLIQWETGKARLHAFTEFAQLAAVARHYARRGEHYLREQGLRGIVPGLTAVREVRHPKGVVGIISPWNFPFYLGVGDLLPALLAGNGAVSKADSQAALSLLWAHELLVEAGLPEGLWQIVTGPGAVIGPALIDQVDYVCFTGSTKTGRDVGARAGARLIGCSLELGGKNPMIVCEDADLGKAVEGSMIACFNGTGQMCISIERIYVHERVYEEFRVRFVDRINALRLGATYDYTVDLGSLTTQAQLDTVTAHVDQARAAGASVLTGGRARPDRGPLFYEPTVLEGVTEAMTVCAEETFGPVVSLYPVKDDEEAVALANAGEYGLSAAVWTRDTNRGKRLAASIISGAVNVNDGVGAAFGSVEAPMGGMRDSGLGRRHGADGIRKFTEPQTIAVQRLLPLTPPSRVSPERFTGFVTRQLRLLKHLRIR